MWLPDGALLARCRSMHDHMHAATVGRGPVYRNAIMRVHTVGSVGPVIPAEHDTLRPNFDGFGNLSHLQGQVETRYLHEPPASERLREVELPPEPEFDAAREALAQNVRRLNDQLFGPLDYAIVARA